MDDQTPIPDDASASQEEMKGIEMSHLSDAVVYYTIDPDILPRRIRERCVELDYVGPDGIDLKILEIIKTNIRDVSDEDFFRLSRISDFIEQAHDIVNLLSHIQRIENIGGDNVPVPQLREGEEDIKTVHKKYYDYYDGEIGFSPDEVLKLSRSFMYVKQHGIPDGITFSPEFHEVMEDIDSLFPITILRMQSMLKREREILTELYSDQEGYAIDLFRRAFALMSNKKRRGKDES
jgi:hypothetical protein